MDKPWKVIFAFVGVFIAGAVFGGLFTLRSSAGRPAPEPVRHIQEPVVVTTTTKAAPNHQEKDGKIRQKELQSVGGIAPALMRRFTQRLNPTVEQRKAISVVVGRAAEDLQRAQRDHLMETERLTSRMYEDVSAVLTPEQRIQLEQMKQETLERVRKEKERQRQESQYKGAGKAAPAGPPIQSRQQGP